MLQFSTSGMRRGRPSVVAIVILLGALGCHTGTGLGPDGSGNDGDAAGQDAPEDPAAGGETRPACEDRMDYVLDDVPWAALASAWASPTAAMADLWVVGGRDQVPAVLHYDGASWARSVLPLAKVAKPQLLWWVSGISPRADMPPSHLFAVGGSGEAICRGCDFDDKTIWRDIATATDADLAGVWGGFDGAGDMAVWAVGGYPGSAQERGVLIKYNGTTWSITRYFTDAGGAVTSKDIEGACTVQVPVALSSKALLTTNNLFKVHGSAWNDVWAVGTGGLALHYDGKKWQCGNVGDPKATLITVFSRGKDDVFAVGYAPTDLGDLDGVLYHFDGTGWTRWPTPPAKPMRGVWADAGEVVIVGDRGAAYRTGPMGGAWSAIATPNTQTLHNVIKVGSTLLASGGNFGDPAVTRHGFLLASCHDIAGGAVANTDGGLDAVIPKPKGNGMGDTDDPCSQDTDCKPGLTCYTVLLKSVCTFKCAGDMDCYNKGFGTNPCCTLSDMRDNVCVSAPECPPDW